MRPETEDGSNHGVEPIALSARQLASILGISIRHIRRLDTDGYLPRPIRLGRALRWHKAEVIGWITAGAPDRATWEQIKEAAAHE